MHGAWFFMEILKQHFIANSAKTIHLDHNVFYQGTKSQLGILCTQDYIKMTKSAL
jgi:hypothetical protein